MRSFLSVGLHDQVVNLIVARLFLDHSLDPLLGHHLKEAGVSFTVTSQTKCRDHPCSDNILPCESLHDLLKVAESHDLHILLQDDDLHQLCAILASANLGCLNRLLTICDTCYKRSETVKSKTPEHLPPRFIVGAFSTNADKLEPSLLSFGVEGLWAVEKGSRLERG